MLKATMIVPIGNFTPELSQRVRERALESAEQREVVISLRSTERYAWSALCHLAQSLRTAATPHRISLTRAVPRLRALLGELGIGNAAFLGDRDFTAESKIVMAHRLTAANGSAPVRSRTLRSDRRMIAAPQAPAYFTSTSAAAVRPNSSGVSSK